MRNAGALNVLNRLAKLSGRSGKYTMKGRRLEYYPGPGHFTKTCPDGIESEMHTILGNLEAREERRIKKVWKVGEVHEVTNEEIIADTSKAAYMVRVR
ncbi:MAG: hypothetical protein L7V15_08075 [Burkholderiales bacterium]|nr:hypothetical protein [Burkholderiales bacterium]